MAPAGPNPALLLVKTHSSSESVPDPSKIAPPFVKLPCAKVRPETFTLALVARNIRLLALPLTVSVLAPGPTIFMSLFKVTGPLVSVIVPVTFGAKVIKFSGTTLRIAWRREPWPPF